MILHCITFELSKIDWTAIGAIASACMIFFTWRSIRVSLKQNLLNRKANEDENNQNRLVQIRLLSYQNKISWINQIRDAIIYSQELFTFAIQDKLLHQSETDIDFNGQMMSELFENGNKVKRRFVTILYGTGAYEDNFLDFINSFCRRYWCYLFDLELFYDIKKCTNSDVLKSKVVSYKQRKNKNTSEYSTDRIWHIIEERNYGIDSQDLSFYINELSKRYPFQDFEDRCLKLIKYEINAANDILNGTKE